MLHASQQPCKLKSWVLGLNTMSKKAVNRKRHDILQRDIYDCIPPVCAVSKDKQTTLFCFPTHSRLSCGRCTPRRSWRRGPSSRELRCRPPARTNCVPWKRGSARRCSPRRRRRKERSGRPSADSRSSHRLRLCASDISRLPHRHLIRIIDQGKIG